MLPNAQVSPLKLGEQEFLDGQFDFFDDVSGRHIRLAIKDIFHDVSELIIEPAWCAEEMSGTSGDYWERIDADPISIPRHQLRLWMPEDRCLKVESPYFGQARFYAQGHPEILDPTRVQGLDV